MMPPAGWYPDPQRPGLQRWWDGAQWIGQPVATPQQPLYGTAASASGTPVGGYRTPYQAPYQTPQPVPYQAPYQAPYTAPTGPGAAHNQPPDAWGAPVPGGYYYAPAPKRSRRWWTGFAVIAIAVLAGLGVGAGFLVRMAYDEVIGPRLTASTYLGDLRDGDYSDAYAQLCVGDQAAVGEARFARAFDARHPTSYRITGVSYHDRNGVKSAEVRFTEVVSDGSSGAQTLTLVHESGDWQICHMGQPPSVWAGVPSDGGQPALPASLRWDAGGLSQSH